MYNFRRKGKHISGFMSKGYAQCVTCMKQQETMKAYHEY